MSQRCFNSMKVRLKQGGGKFDFEVREQFQFHEGPIKTQRGGRTRTDLTRFQFHEGPIKTEPKLEVGKAASAVSIP